MEVKKYFLKYADDELRISLVPADGPAVDGENNGRVVLVPADGPSVDGGNKARVVQHRRKFKYIDGVERLCDMELP